jgi:FkbH-like protein
MYRAQAARQAEEERYSNLDDFLRSLEIEVGIDAAVPFSIPRIAQLTQKTNQMNMTTRRYTESQIQAFARDPDWGVYSVTSRDRFGDNGIIGVLMLKYQSAECRIDTFLLSCRVIGRGIEQLMVAFAAELCRRRGVRTLVGEFIPTAKNQPAAGFYERVGFQPITGTLLGKNLEQAGVDFPEHIRFAAGTAGAGSGG